MTLATAGGIARQRRLAADERPGRLRYGFGLNVEVDLLLSAGVQVGFPKGPA